MRVLVQSLRTALPRVTVRVQPRPVSLLRPAPCNNRQLITRPTSTVAGLRSRHTKPLCTAAPGQPLRASTSVLGLAAAASLTLAATLYCCVAPGILSRATDDSWAESSVANSVQLAEKHLGHFVVGPTDDDMTMELPPGRVGSLTPEQEEKLRQLWAAIFKVCQYDLPGTEAGDGADNADAADDEDAGEAGVPESVSSATPGDKKKEKKKKRHIFKRSKKDSAPNAPSAPAPAADTSVASVTKAVATVDLAATTEDDKYGQSKVFQEALASMSPETIRNTIWSMVKHDHPDALVLRFLRARKWDVDKALVMLVSTMHWRAQDMHVDDDIMAKGEGGAVEEAASSTDEKAKTVSEDFLAQLRMGKSFLHGSDKQGRPICIVRVRLHHQGDQVEESVERSTVYTIETARMALHPPVDTATVIFDMTGFSLANMDYSPVKFMIKCFEANYPECLGAVLVHKAPWLFQGIWRIIRGWLDPVVASKVHFTNNVNDMEEFISKDQIIKELDGDEDWTYTYLEPERGENDKMKDTATRDKLLADRQQLYQAFSDATARWITTSDEGQIKALRAKREDIAKQLREQYWTLDPYVRARSLYDRTGMLRPDGTVDFYAEIKKDEITQTNGNAVAQDDVD